MTRAAIRRAMDEGHVGNAHAWDIERLTADSAGEDECKDILPAELRAAIIGAACPAAGALFRALELTGARPKEVQALTVKDFNPAKGTVRFGHRKGKGAKLRTRMTVLGAEGLAFFIKQSKSKLPNALLFPDAEGQPFTDHDRTDAFRSAVAKLRAQGIAVPDYARPYSFRHARISELLQLHGIDPITVATQTGTGVAQIEKHYYRFIESAMHAKLAAIRA